MEALPVGVCNDDLLSQRDHGGRVDAARRESGGSLVGKEKNTWSLAGRWEDSLYVHCEWFCIGSWGDGVI